MAKEFLCIEKNSGRRVGTYGPTESAPPPSTETHVFIDADTLPDATPLDTIIDLTPVDDGHPGGLWTGQRVAADPVVNTKLTHADVLSLLTPTEWSEMNRFQPDAAGVSNDGVPLNDADVFWAVSVFNKAAYVDLSDTRFSQIMALLSAKSVLSPSRAAELQEQLAAMAASKKNL